MFQTSFSLNIPNWCRCRYLTSYTASGHHHIGIVCTKTTEAKRNDDEIGETERKSLKSKRAYNNNQLDTWPDINKWHNIPKERKLLVAFISWIHLCRHLNTMFIIGSKRKPQKANTPSLQSMSMSHSYETKQNTEFEMYRAYPNASTMDTSMMNSANQGEIGFTRKMNSKCFPDTIHWLNVKWMHCETLTLAERLNAWIYSANAEYHHLYVHRVYCQKWNLCDV